MTAIATYGVFRGPLPTIKVQVRGLKAMTTTVPSILTTVETVFALTMIDMPEGSKVGFSESRECTKVLYVNDAELEIAVMFMEPYSKLFVCVNYGAGFRDSLLDPFTVLEFRNGITVVAMEDTRVN